MKGHSPELGPILTRFCKYGFVPVSIYFNTYDCDICQYFLNLLCAEIAYSIMSEGRPDAFSADTGEALQ
jgi:hypothetical protein